MICFVYTNYKHLHGIIYASESLHQQTGVHGDAWFRVELDSASSGWRAGYRIIHVHFVNVIGKDVVKSSLRQSEVKVKKNWNQRRFFKAWWFVLNDVAVSKIWKATCDCSDGRNVEELNDSLHFLFYSCNEFLKPIFSSTVSLIPNQHVVLLIWPIWHNLSSKEGNNLPISDNFIILHYYCSNSQCYQCQEGPIGLYRWAP